MSERERNRSNETVRKTRQARFDGQPWKEASKDDFLGRVGGGEGWRVKKLRKCLRIKSFDDFLCPRLVCCPLVFGSTMELSVSPQYGDGHGVGGLLYVLAAG